MVLFEPGLILLFLFFPRRTDGGQIMYVVLIEPANEKPGQVIPCINEDAARQTVWRLRKELDTRMFYTELPEWLVEMLPNKFRSSLTDV